MDRKKAILKNDNGMVKSNAIIRWKWLINFYTQKNMKNCYAI